LNDTDRRSSVTVRIAGEEHTIRANAEPEYTRSCARYVDDRIADIRGKGALIKTHKAAILAALSISDELFQARDELDRTRREMASRATILARRLEVELQASPSKG
jgi:cell division protein ZapA